MPTRTFDWFDRRLGLSRGPGRKLLNYVFPDHFSFLFGEIAFYAFVVLVLSGVFLTLYFVPSSSHVVYHGSYVPLRGRTVSEAYASTIDLSFGVRAGLLVRQVHHWAADIFVGAIVVHMARIFFTGAFRRPREANWAVGVTLLLLAIMNGYMGYSLPDDLLSGTGLRIGFSITESIPFVGSYIAFWLFGGNFPGPDLTRRFYILHVFVLPGIIAALIAVHLGMIIRMHHADFPGKHKRNDNVVGTPLWPAYAAKSIGFMTMVTGVLLLLGGFVQINPIWRYGPYEAYLPSDATQPDWYVGWLEGALRLFPGWETVFPGHMVPEQFFPAVLLPALTWGLFYAYPYLEAKLTRDRRAHHLLDFPRGRPLRTAFGVGFFSFYAVLFVAGSDDVLADWLHFSLFDIVWALRIALLVVPPLAAAVTWRMCHAVVRLPARREHPRMPLSMAEGDYFVAAPAATAGKEEELEPVELD
jgi:ubiquinol-cytochrome c reductase cytochrome b subunit